MRETLRLLNPHAECRTEELRELFGKAGFIEDENKFDIRELKNRKRKVRSSSGAHSHSVITLL
jgi:hypothetical protein